MTRLYRGGRVRTPTHPAATALLVDRTRVAWVGDPREPGAPGPDDVDEVADLDGAVLMPAFVDAHVHVTETGLLLDGVDLRPARSVAQVLRLVEAAARRGRGRPVIGQGWDETRLAEGRAPTRFELDRAAAGGVVYLARVDVHSAVVSSALALASGAAGCDGWDDDGRVERDAHHAARAATRAGLTPAQRRELQTLALTAAAAHGLACVHEMSAPHIAPEADLCDLVALTGADEAALPRVVAYRGQLVGDVDEAQAVLDRFRAGGVHLAGLGGDLNIDGSVGSRTCAMREDYTDRAGHRGHLYLSVESVRDHVVACTLAGVQAGFHVIGDAGVDVAVEGLLAAASVVGVEAVRAAGHRLEHVECIDAAGIAALARLRVTASVQPAFDAEWGGDAGMYATRLGHVRALTMNPFGGLVAAGVPIALGSDSPVTPFDPWGAVRACLGHHVPDHRLPLDVAVAAHTGADVVTGGPATFAVWENTVWENTVWDEHRVGEHRVGEHRVGGHRVGEQRRAVAQPAHRARREGHPRSDDGIPVVRGSFVVAVAALLRGHRGDPGHHGVGDLSAGPARAAVLGHARDPRGRVDRRAEPHGDGVHAGEPGVHGLHPVGADDRHRDDRCAGGQRQPSDTGAAAVETAVTRPRALGVDPEGLAGPEDVERGLQRGHRVTLALPAHGHGVHHAEERRDEPPAHPVALEVLRLREEPDAAGDRQRDHHAVDERQVVAGDDHRTLAGHVLEAAHGRAPHHPEQHPHGPPGHAVQRHPGYLQRVGPPLRHRTLPPTRLRLGASPSGAAAPRRASAVTAATDR